MTIFSFFFAAYILAQAATASAAILPPAKEVAVSRVSSSGSGCPANSLSFSTSPDRTTLTVGFDKFRVYLGPGVSPRDRSKECEVRIDVSYPRGYTFSVIETTYHGFAAFDNAVTAVFNTTYSFPNGPDGRVSSTQTALSGSAGAAGGVFTRAEAIPAAARVRAPCGGNTTLAARTRIALSSSRATAQEVEFPGTANGEDLPITQQVRLEWEQCNP